MTLMSLRNRVTAAFSLQGRFYFISLCGRARDRGGQYVHLFNRNLREKRET